MSNTYIFGDCYFEVSAIKALLSSTGVVSHSLSLFDIYNITKSDNLILCLSSVPILGWMKYLSLINSVYQSVKCKIIVLIPDNPSKLFNSNKHIVFLCGKLSIKKLLTSLSDLTQLFYVHGQIKNQLISKGLYFWVLRGLIEHISVTDQALRFGLNYKTIFHYRMETVRYLGFSSYHRMSVYFSNSDKLTIFSLKKLFM